MVRSLVVVLAVVGVVLLVAPGRFGDSVPERDFSTEVASARRSAPYEILAPVGLPRGWETTSVRYRTDADGPVHWHMGFDSPSGYAGLEQSNRRPAAFLAEQVPAAKRMGEMLVGGAAWRRYSGDQTEPRALVRVSRGVSTVVLGDASWADLQRLATSLRGG